MILVPFFAISTAYGSTKNLLSLPFQAPVFFVLLYSTFLSSRIDKLPLCPLKGLQICNKRNQWAGRHAKNMF